VRAPSPWTVLGLKGPANRSEVRRAYASRLKQVNPEDDPKGFEQLRLAYESALAVAAAKRPDEPPAAAAASFLHRPDRAGPTAELLPGADSDFHEPAARAARGRLESLLAGPGASDGAALKAAVDDLLAPSALDALSARADTELWLAELILANMPRSNLLLTEAFLRFRWDASARSRDVAPAILRVIGRHEDMLAREELTLRGRPHHRAFVALASPTGRRLMIRGLFAPHLAGEVGDLVRMIRTRYPTLVHDIDPGSLAWWEGYLSRTRASPLVLWAVIVALIMAVGGVATVLHTTPIERLVVCFGALASCFVLIAVEQFAVATIGRSSKSRDGGDTPAWLRLGWAPASAMLLIIAPILPSAPVLVAVGGGMAAAACVWWMFATGERDRVSATEHVAGGVNAFVPALRGLPLLLFTWSFLVCRLAGVSIFSATAVALLGGLIVAIWGESRLMEVWSIAGRGPARWWAAAILAAATFIAAVALVVSAFDQQVWPLAAGLVAVAVLASRAPLGMTRWQPALLYQGVLRVTGLFAVLPGLAVLLEGSASFPDDVAPALARVFGGVLLVGPALAVTEMLRGELVANPRSA
jgi:hypothetical protein